MKTIHFKSGKELKIEQEAFEILAKGIELGYMQTGIKKDGQVYLIIIHDAIEYIQ